MAILINVDEDYYMWINKYHEDFGGPFVIFEADPTSAIVIKRHTESFSFSLKRQLTLTLRGRPIFNTLVVGVKVILPILCTEGGVASNQITIE